MYARYPEKINGLFEELFLEGSVLVTWNKFYLWVGNERMGRAAWRAVWDMWAQYCIDHGYNVVPVEILRNKFSLILRREAFSDEETESLESKC